MALPKTGSRRDAVVRVEFDPDGAPGVFTNWCGTKNFSMSGENEIQNEKVAPCDDWDAPVETQKEFSGQNFTATMDANWTSKTHRHVSDWFFDQKRLRVQVYFPYAQVNEIEYYDGVAMLQSLELSEIGNLDGNKISENVSLEFDGTPTRTFKAA